MHCIWTKLHCDSAGQITWNQSNSLSSTNHLHTSAYFARFHYTYPLLTFSIWNLTNLDKKLPFLFLSIDLWYFPSVLDPGHDSPIEVLTLECVHRTHYTGLADVGKRAGFRQVAHIWIRAGRNSPYFSPVMWKEGKQRSGDTSNLEKIVTPVIGEK